MVSNSWLRKESFARATFFSDYRHLLPESLHPTLLIQSEVDALAEVSIGHYMERQMPDSTLTILPTEGHCPHMTHPALVLDAIQDYLAT